MMVPTSSHCKKKNKTNSGISVDFLIDELKVQKVKLSWGKKEKNQNR